MTISITTTEPASPAPSSPGPPTFLEKLVTPVLVLGVVLLLAGVAALIGEDTQNQIAALVLVLAGMPLTVVLTRGLAESHDRRFLLRVVYAAVFLRVGLALLLHTRVPVGFFAPDQITYQSVGHRLLLYHQGMGSLPWQVTDTWEVGYFYWNALLYWVFGFAPLAPKIANCFFGALVGVVAYRIAGELAGKGAARRAAVLVSFFPSLVLWSALNLRDTVVVLIIGAILLATLRARVRPTALRVLGIVAGLLALVILRDYMAVMMLFALVGSFLISPARHVLVNTVVGLGLLGLAVWAYEALGLGAQWVESASFEALDLQRQLMATGGTAFEPGTDISSPIQGLRYLPLGLAFFFLSPFPWQMGSLLSRITLPEMIVWFTLIPFVFSGSWWLIRNRFNRVEPVLIFTVLTSIVYALVEANAGTAYRHRAQVLVFLLIFAAVGLHIWHERRKSAAARERVR